VSSERYLTANNRAERRALIDGPEIFPAFRDLIASATVEVDLQTYVWEPDSDPANEILAGLAELARRRAAAPGTDPVVVRFLFDVSVAGFGSRIDTLPLAWASIEALALDPAHVRVELAGFFHVAFGNLHVKTVVVDGRDAIITGANPQAHHDYAEPWRDAGFRLAGDVALALREDFDDAWRQSKQWMCGAMLGDQYACTVETAPIAREATPRAAAADDDATCLPMFVVTRAADANPASNRIDNTQDQALLAAFDGATRHIHMQTPNLNDDAAKAALIAAVVRGVQVDIVLSKGFNDQTESAPGQGGTNEQNVARMYEALAAAGITDACERLRFRWHARDGVAVFGNGPFASHAKYASVDDTIAIAGTANMDTQSWNNSREVNVIVDDPDIATAWDDRLFARDFASGVVVDQCR
jgi:phosphatidylserine/phosphatidylglycerophosphate/cardiolipin synthase-like enzyme